MASPGTLASSTPSIWSCRSLCLGHHTTGLRVPPVLCLMGRNKLEARSEIPRAPGGASSDVLIKRNTYNGYTSMG